MVYLKYVRRKDIQELLYKNAMAGFAPQSAGLAKAASLWAGLINRKRAGFPGADA